MYAAGGPNWTAILQPAQAGQADWSIEPEFVEPKAAYWNSLLRQVLDGEQRGSRRRLNRILRTCPGPPDRLIDGFTEGIKMKRARSALIVCLDFPRSPGRCNRGGYFRAVLHGREGR